MKQCCIDFPKEVVKGVIGTKEEVKAFLKDLNGRYSYEGKQRIRNRETHKWEDVIVYSHEDYFFGTEFVCYKIVE